METPENEINNKNKKKNLRPKYLQHFGEKKPKGKSIFI